MILAASRMALRRLTPFFSLPAGPEVLPVGWSQRTVHSPFSGERHGGQRASESCSKLQPHKGLSPITLHISCVSGSTPSLLSPGGTQLEVQPDSGHVTLFSGLQPSSSISFIEL